MSGPLVAGKMLALGTGTAGVMLASAPGIVIAAVAGALQALGLGLFDAQGNSLPRGGLALAHVARIELTGLDPRLPRYALKLPKTQP